MTDGGAISENILPPLRLPVDVAHLLSFFAAADIYGIPILIVPGNRGQSEKHLCAHGAHLGRWSPNKQAREYALCRMQLHAVEKN